MHITFKNSNNMVTLTTITATLTNELANTMMATKFDQMITALKACENPQGKLAIKCEIKGVILAMNIMGYRNDAWFKMSNEAELILSSAL